MGDLTEVETTDTATTLLGDGAETATETETLLDDSTSTETEGGEDTDANEGEGAGTEENGESPETYADFTMPEGMELDANALELAAPMFKELNLDQAGAQKAVDIYAKLVQAGTQRQADEFDQTLKDWQKSAKDDSEYGGDGFDENIKIAQAGLNAYVTPELKKVLFETGLETHPEMIRFMFKVGQTLKEDVPGSTGGASTGGADPVSILYPNDRKE